MIKRKLEQMKIKEAKRVAKLLKAIPAKTKMELKDLVHRMLDNDLKQLGENKDG